MIDKKNKIKLDIYRDLILSVLDIMLDRFESDKSYPFIDMKFSSITGKDFSAQDRKRGKKTIYSWIQGRGIEALAGHAKWIEKEKSISHPVQVRYLRRIKNTIITVSKNMEKVRKLNNGHVPFMFDTNGRPIVPGPDKSLAAGNYIKQSEQTLSNLFYFKGLAVSSIYTGNTKKSKEAQEKFSEIVDSLFSGQFVFDQQTFDKKNPINEDCILEGGYMIALGGAAALLEYTGSIRYLEIGERITKHIINNYVNININPEYGKQYDMWEENDNCGRPLLRGGVLRSDPGHAIEFAGLALKLIVAAEKQMLVRFTAPEIKKLIKTLGSIIKINFSNGFAKYGIVKSFDLVSQKVTNSEMPWWSMPETMRAAFLAHYLSSSKKSDFVDIFNQCSEVFLRYFINRKNHCVAYQCLDSSGVPVDTIPATPDIDPGYHTGLSLIDIMNTDSDF